MKQFLLLIILSILIQFSYAQGDSIKHVQNFNPQIATTMSGWKGQIMLATDLDFTYLNLGVPTFKYEYKKISLECSFLPSLRINMNITKNKIIPILGAGFSIAYSKYVIGFPMYYNAASDAWSLSIGLGYRF